MNLRPRTKLPDLCLLLLCFLCARSIGAAAAEPLLTQYTHRSWTSNEGLPQDSVKGIAQTPDGFLWIATQEGIARFDGTQFTVFDSRTTNGVLPNFVYTLFVDRSGTLWAGGGDGIIRYEGEGRWTRFHRGNGWPGISAKFISEDGERNLWIGMGNDAPGEGWGLAQFRDGRARIFAQKEGLANGQVFQTAVTPDGAVWAGTREGLAEFRNGRFIHYGAAEGLPPGRIGAVTIGRDGTLWLGSDHGLVQMRDRRVARVFTTRDGLPADRIECVREDGRGALWIGTDRGLARMMNGRIEPVRDIPGLSDGPVIAIFADRERNLWIGTQSLGLHRLSVAKFTPFGPPEGLRGEVAHAIVEDRDGRIWVASESPGLGVLDGERFREAGPRVSAAIVESRALLLSRDGSMWIGGKGGLHRLRGNVITSFTRDEGLPASQVNVIFEDRDGTVLVGTGEGIARFEGTRFVPLTLPESAPDSVRVIHRARDGRLWIAGGDGIGYLDGEQFVPLLGEELPDANVYAMIEDPDGVLWVTTWSQGMYRIAGNHLTRIREADGMYDDVAWSIVDDRLGFFWLGSNRGIFRVARRELNEFAAGRIKRVSYTLFGTADGMRKRETNAGSPAAMRSRDGRLWFSTTAGVVAIDPARPVANAAPLEVVIERFVANDVVLSERKPKLAPGTRNVEIHYVAPSLVTPERVRYRYRLRGYDDRWIEAGSRRDAFYTNIDPGKYRFEVIAANEDGVWSKRATAIEFQLEPRLYQRQWFLPLLALAMVLIGFGLKSLIERDRAMRHDRFHDPLTGLPNRRLLSVRAEAALTQARRRGRSIAILFLDLDGFKTVNDAFGHSAGDKVLEIVAARFARCVAEIDTLARIGGDEFAVLIPDLEDEARAAALARRLVDVLREPIDVEGERANVGVSIGIALHPFDGEDIKGILQAADRAMYRAKTTGGNTHQFNAEHPDETVTLDVRWETRGHVFRRLEFDGGQ